MRRFLDRLYALAAAAAALCLASIAVLMLAQALMRQGELVRVSLVLTELPPRARRHAESACLIGALVVVAYATWAVSKFVYESWQFKELAQGLLQIPIWIPQMSLVIGCAVLFVGVLDELVVHLQGEKTAYERAEELRRSQADFSDQL